MSFGWAFSIGERAVQVDVLDPDPPELLDEDFGSFDEGQSPPRIPSRFRLRVGAAHEQGILELSEGEPMVSRWQ
jgi:hypothetical protein